MRRTRVRRYECDSEREHERLNNLKLTNLGEAGSRIAEGDGLWMSPCLRDGSNLRRKEKDKCVFDERNNAERFRHHFRFVTDPA